MPTWLVLQSKWPIKEFFIFVILVWTCPCRLVLQFSFTYLDLPLTASSPNFYFFILTYLWLPILQNFIFSSGLTSDCQAKHSSNHLNKFDRLDLLSLEKSCFGSLQKYLSDFHFFISFFHYSLNAWSCRLFFFSFIFLYFFVKCKNANIMPQLCRWNAMIDLTNVICKHCALICYW